ncbi:MAG TPA: hypothetical protein VGO43_06690 [Pyrinomonadaceae bacterium]|nr:hypothetical protein [Pyrinomonadaceae bacterium]
MFCPSCGAQETQPNQFCRACGGSFVPQTDAVTSSAISAREEIGRAMAQKIRELGSAKELKKVAEDVLPEIEKFLESPAEKRLRRIRVGTILSAIGIGVSIALGVLAVLARKEEFLFLSAMGGILFFIGIAFMINGYLLTVAKGSRSDENAVLGKVFAPSIADLSLPAGESPKPFRSVTEGTTTHLAEKQPIRRN